MKKGISQLVIGVHRSVRECLEVAKRCGYDALELTMRDEAELSFRSTESDCARLRQLSAQFGIEFCSLCPYVHGFTDMPPDQWGENKQRTEKALQTAAALGIDAILFIPGGVTPAVPYDVAYERSLRALRELAPLAERYKVALAVENVWNKLFLSPLEARDLIAKVGSEYVGWFFDVGNVVIFGYPEQWIRILGNAIKRIHFKDFAIDHRTRSYQWTQLMDGQVNWQAVMEALRQVGYDGYVISEVSGDEAAFAETAKRMDRIIAL